MLIYLDLDTNRLVIGPGNSGITGGYITPRGSGGLLRVQPVQGGQLVALPAGFEMTWSVKPADDWGGAMVAYADGFTQEAGSTVVSCAVNYETEALDGLLEIGQSPEKDSVSLLAQLAWRVSDTATWRPTQVVDLHLHNSVWRGTPGAPIPSQSSFDWLVGALVAAAGVTLTVGLDDTITIGLALVDGAGMKVTTSGSNKVVAQDVQYAVAATGVDYFGGSGVSPAFASDPVLQFTAVANAVYEVDFYASFVQGQAGGGVALAQWSLPSGNVRGQWLAPVISGPDLKIRPDGPMSAQGGIYDADDTFESGVSQKALIQIGSTGGTVALQLRSDYTVPTSKLTRQADSFLIARRIS